MADMNRRCIVRSILGLGGPLAKEHADNSAVKNVKDTIADHIATVGGKWFDTCKDVMRMLGDGAFLVGSGLRVGALGASMKDLNPESDFIQAEDMAAARVWRIAKCLCKERVASMCRRKTYPDELAPLCSGGDRAKYAMEKFKETWDSYIWVLRHDGDATMREIALHHSLASRHMQDTARIIRSVDYDHESRQVQQRVTRYFSGLAHEAIFENCMRELRHQENKVTANQVVKGVKAYLAPVDKRLLKDFERAEIDISSVLPVSSDIVKSPSIFKPEKEVKSRAKLSGVKGKDRWPTWGNESIKAQSVLESLGRDLFTKDNPDLAQLVWRSEVVPVGEIVLHRKSETEPAWIVLVQHTCKYGIIGWPVNRIGSCSVFVDLNAPDVVFKHVYCFDSMSVLNTRALSPSHCELLEVDVRNRGVVLSHGSFTDLLQWQAEAGFLGCGETVLKNIFEDQKWEPPALTEPRLDYEATLCLALMREVRPHTTNEEAVEALSLI